MEHLNIILHIIYWQYNKILYYVTMQLSAVFTTVHIDVISPFNGVHYLGGLFRSLSFTQLGSTIMFLNAFIHLIRPLITLKGQQFDKIIQDNLTDR